MILLFLTPKTRRRHRCGRNSDPQPRRAFGKAAAAAAVSQGVLTPGQACSLFRMNPRELELWRDMVQDNGLRRMFALWS